jgi:hypothetical protein
LYFPRDVGDRITPRHGTLKVFQLEEIRLEHLDYPGC